MAYRIQFILVVIKLKLQYYLRAINFCRKLCTSEY